jgi:hypothetical protein
VPEEFRQIGDKKKDRRLAIHIEGAYDAFGQSRSEIQR